MNQPKILLLDDDKFLTDIYKEKFEAKGALVQATHGVEEAMRILRGGFVPDAVLLDVEMKEKDGFAFLQEIKDQRLAQGAYLITLTNHSGEGDRERAHKLGAHRYIVKVEMIPDEVVLETLQAVQKTGTQ